MESPNSPRPKKVRQAKSKVKSMLIIFFNIKGTVHKEFVLAGKMVNFSYYCDFVRRLRENVGRLRPELWRQRNSMLHHDNAPSCTSFFTREFLFTKTNMAVIPTDPTFRCFPLLKIKLKGRHFDTIEVIETDLQTALNNLREQDLQDVFKKWQKRWERCLRV
jgi:hypothetical protein